VLRGDLDDLDTLRAGAAGSDGVIHLAFIHDFTDIEASVTADRRAIETMGGVLEGSGKPLVIVSGTPSVPGRVATERDEPAPGSPVAGRAANARAALGMAARGVRSSVVGLPRTVHGNGSNRWPAVHVLDAAHLFRLAVEQAPAGSRLHAVGDQGVPILDIAEVISRHLNVPTASVPAGGLGFLGHVLSVDQPASATLTRELLGWRPVEPGLIEDMDKGHYFG
jgi:nucleoside-diphosphate-sugar epimerase